MNVGQIMKADIANGPGIRVAVFVSGCRLHCKNCFQPETWNFDYGVEFTDALLEEVLTTMKKPHYNGLTILGGEPFEPENQAGVLDLARRFKEVCPKKNLWIYSGNEIETLLDPTSAYYTDCIPSIMELADVIVCGPFVQEFKRPGLRYKGSENQRIVDVQASRAKGEIVTLNF